MVRKVGKFRKLATARGPQTRHNGQFPWIPWRYGRSAGATFPPNRRSRV